LKQEWEQAQKEVEEEERRYHEEVKFLSLHVSQFAHLPLTDIITIFTTIQNVTDSTDAIVIYAY